MMSTVEAQVDLHGVWQVKAHSTQLLPRALERPAFTPAGKEQYEKNRAAVAKHDVAVDRVQRCASPGMPRIMLFPYPFEFLQESGYIAIVFGWNQVFRQIVLDGSRDSYVLPSAMGFSSGRWDNDTLVVTTTDLSGTSLLDSRGLPHGEKLKLTEHLHLKKNGRTLEDRLTIDDPEFYVRPWDVELEFDRLALAQPDEDVCLDRVAAGHSPETPSKGRNAR
jgi:hypothetical protein